MERFLHYSCQQIDEDDIHAVVQVLRAEALTMGPAITQFEQALCAYAKAPFAAAVSSATAGLHLAAMALGVGPGDQVWTTPLSFVATANCALYAGAQIRFVDVDEKTGNLCPRKLEAALQKARAENSLPKLVIIVHYTGRPCDMEALYALKKEYGFSLVEDAAHALGAQYAGGRPVGGDARTDATVFSFHPVKPITTGEGGAVITHNQTLDAQIRQLRTHGVTRDAGRMEHKDKPAWYYEQQSLGYNYRMTDIQAALGTSQMKKLDRFIAARRALARRYPEMLEGLPLALPPASEDSGWHLYVVQLPESASRDAVFETLREQKIGVNVHYMPIHLHPYYRKLGFAPGQFPAAEHFFARLITLPLHPGLAEADQERVAAALRAAL